MKKFFITGIDTDIGKTFVCKGLALMLADKGLKVGYFKPFQSGAYEKEGVLIAPDVMEFREYPEIVTGCSYLLKGEVSPYLASKMAGVDIKFEKIKGDIDEFSRDKDIVLVEGAGGFYCPVAKKKLIKDAAKFLDCETIVVATPALGRLNHLLMTLECAGLNSIKIKGIIINKMPREKTLSEQNFIEELRDFCDVEILGIIEKMSNPSKKDIIEMFSKINL